MNAICLDMPQSDRTSSQTIRGRRAPIRSRRSPDASRSIGDTRTYRPARAIYRQIRDKTNHSRAAEIARVRNCRKRRVARAVQRRRNLIVGRRSRQHVSPVRKLASVGWLRARATWQIATFNTRLALDRIYRVTFRPYTNAAYTEKKSRANATWADNGSRGNERIIGAALSACIATYGRDARCVFRFLSALFSRFLR